MLREKPVRAAMRPLDRRFFESSRICATSIGLNIFLEERGEPSPILLVFLHFFFTPLEMAQSCGDFWHSTAAPYSQKRLHFGPHKDFRTKSGNSSYTCNERRIDWSSCNSAGGNWPRSLLHTNWPHDHRVALFVKKSQKTPKKRNSILRLQGNWSLKTHKPL